MYTKMTIISPSGYNDQEHVHEFTGSTRRAEAGDERHNHRTAGVTGEAIPFENGRHVHKFHTTTDFVEDHFHGVCGTTGPDIRVSDKTHVHFIDVCTTLADGHKHRVEFATLIDPNPVI